ncbi:MAG: hypothetical protein ABSA30_11930 [Candidatus Aminicenantales bacterium]|jgi:hypothetical protein
MKSLSRLIPAALAMILVFGLPLVGQNKPSPNMLAGSWAVEVNAGGESYYLTLDFKVTDGKLEGALSEQSGMFTAIPLTAIEWDGTLLKFGCKIPTPPDGTERATKSEMKYEADKLTGTITIEDMGMTAAMTATKK